MTRMDALVEDARTAYVHIEEAKRAATLDYYRACARVVEDEQATGEKHGSQVRAALRLGITPQYMSKMLKEINWPVDALNRAV